MTLALRAAARKIFKKSSLFLLIRASGRHLWECKSFCGDKRDASWWTEPTERLCCLHFSTPRPYLAEAFLRARNCLVPVVYLKTGKGVSVCTLPTVSLNAFLKTVSWEKFHQTFVFICESIMSEGYNSVRRFNFKSNPAMSRDYPNPPGNIISL